AAAKAIALLPPAVKEERVVPPIVPTLADLIDPATHLVAYPIKRSGGQAKHQKRVDVLLENQLGTLRFETQKEERLLAPANKSLESMPPMPDGLLIEVDHYKCYKLKPSRDVPGSQQDARGKFRPRQVLVIDQFENGRPFVCQPGSPRKEGRRCKDDRTCGGDKDAFDFCQQGDPHPDYGAAHLYDLRKPKRFCIPVEKRALPDSGCPVKDSALHQPTVGLACYEAKLAKRTGPNLKIEPRQAKHVVRRPFVQSWLAPHQVTTSREQDLCIPSLLLDGGAPR
ncbi:MAG: hypothetical protein MJE66_21750, partial [Proteobacteria bacterium]|nr:hypothetical protein [Pseudomonadota bacterium]